jgi:hypothetical protein
MANVELLKKRIVKEKFLNNNIEYYFIFETAGGPPGP